jgi:hypothetical protein
MSDVPYVRLVDSLVVRRLIVEDSAELPGGGGPVGFEYTCTGSENPLGFPIVFASLSPPVVPPSSYVALCQYKSGTGFVLAVVASVSPTQVSILVSEQPVAGDVVTVIICPTP